jgi:hypothetical protein
MPVPISRRATVRPLNQQPLSVSRAAKAFPGVDFGAWIGSLCVGALAEFRDNVRADLCVRKVHPGDVLDLKPLGTHAEHGVVTQDTPPKDNLLRPPAGWGCSPDIALSPKPQVLNPRRENTDSTQLAHGWTEIGFRYLLKALTCVAVDKDRVR